MREDDEWAWIHTLGPAAKECIMRWIESPLSFAEVLEDEPHKDAILQELIAGGHALIQTNGVPVLCWKNEPQETSDLFPCFHELSPVTQAFIVRWCASPWTVQELLEDEPEREVIEREIKEYDVLLLE